jgi:hypothetical protein
MQTGIHRDVRVPEGRLCAGFSDARHGVAGDALQMPASESRRNGGNLADATAPTPATLEPDAFCTHFCAR